MPPRTITPQDLYRFRLIQELQISPDGGHVVFTVQRVDRKTEKKYTNLWLVSTRSGRSRQFTTGNQNDTTPRWSPDGKTIAFVSNRDDEKQPQIYIIPTDGGEARKLTNLKGRIASLEWSPDGKRLLIGFREPDPDVLEREKDPRKKDLGPEFFHLTRLHYKADGMGLLPKRTQHLWLVDARTGKATQLTPDHEIYEEYGAVWSPDGKWIYYLSNRQPDPDRAPEAIDIFRIPAEGGEPERIPTPVGPKGNLAISPDGKWLAYLGNEGLFEWWRATSLWVVPTDGSGEARNLTIAHDMHTSASIINDLIAAISTTPPQWTPDSEALYFQNARHGKVQLCRIRRDGTGLETLIDEKGAVGALSLSKDGHTLAYFYGNLTDPGQIYRMDTATGRRRQLTRLNAWLRRTNLGETEEVWFTNPEDGYRLQGWILKPPDFDPSKKYPLIMEIHGGPMTQYGFLMMHEFYTLAAQGYVVGFCNPRGGTGYGEAHTKAIWGNWGDRDYSDIMAWADYLAALPYVDKERMFVTGGSYGGYMTLWVVGHTGRFKAAAAQRSVSNHISMWGASDMNYLTQHLIGVGKPPWEALDDYWRMSPLPYLHKATTPTLIIHSEQDLRCPIDQGEQAYVALKYSGVETEFVRFPGESHGLSRVGRTDRRIARLNYIVGWFNKHLR